MALLTKDVLGIIMEIYFYKKRIMEFTIIPPHMLKHNITISDKDNNTKLIDKILAKKKIKIGDEYKQKPNLYGEIYLLTIQRNKYNIYTCKLHFWQDHGYNCCCYKAKHYDDGETVFYYFVDYINYNKQFSTEKNKLLEEAKMI